MAKKNLKITTIIFNNNMDLLRIDIFTKTKKVIIMIMMTDSR